MNQLQDFPEERPIPWRLSGLAILVIVLGFLVRLYSFHFTPVINLDGVRYIQQAKALHYGHYDSILTCHHYLSNYPILIAFGYEIFGDWVTSAKAVSLLFGTLTLAPLYLLFRRFLGHSTSVLTLLVFALSPPFVELSREVIRGPVYWFFSALGLYLFILQIEKRCCLYVFLSSVAFILAAWGRVEAALFILVSSFYILFWIKGDKWKRIFFFLLPPALISAMVAVAVLVTDLDLLELAGHEKILSWFPQVKANYQELRENLKSVAESAPAGFSPYFVEKVRNLLWFIAMGVLVVQLKRAFFLPFFLVFLLGAWTWRRRVLRDSRLIYLCLVSLTALMVLYGQILYNWAMSNRFAILFLLPACVFSGFGMARIRDFLSQRIKLKQPLVCSILVVLVLFAALPKNLKTDERASKVVFKKMGDFIAREEGSSREVTLVGAFKEAPLVHFYAHLSWPVAPCFNGKNLIANVEQLGPNFFKRQRFDYLIWDESNGSQQGLRHLIQRYRTHITQIGEWKSRKLGRLILFRVES